MSASFDDRIDAVLVAESNRSGRAPQDRRHTLNWLAGRNVSVAAMGGITIVRDRPRGRMIATLRVGIARRKRDLMSERLKFGLAAAKARGKMLDRQPGQRPRSDRFAPKVMALIAEGRTTRWIDRGLGISKNTVLANLKRSA